MTNKAYIVANEQQEREVLAKLEQEGLVWIMGGEKPTEWVPSRDAPAFKEFPIVLTDEGEVSWWVTIALGDEEIVFDGRKEEKMSEKYVVSQEFMNELEEWKKRGNTEVYFVGSYDLSMLPDYVKRWWTYPEINNFESNNHLIAILRWVNGEDVFEVEKPKKWIVRNKDSDEIGSYWYVWLHVGTVDVGTVDGRTFDSKDATRFETKEEAESWANAHQEVIEVEE